MAPAGAPERVRTLLLRADNRLKNGGAERAPEVLGTLEEARAVAADPAVSADVRELVEIRIAAVRGLLPEARG